MGSGIHIGASYLPPDSPRTFNCTPGKKQIDIYYYGDNDGMHYYFVSPSMNYSPLLPFSDWKSQRDGRVEVYIDQANQARDWAVAVESLKPTMQERFGLIRENLMGYWSIIL